MWILNNRIRLFKGPHPASASVRISGKPKGEGSYEDYKDLDRGYYITPMSICSLALLSSILKAAHIWHPHLGHNLGEDKPWSQRDVSKRIRPCL